jgi:hypothetical protein
MFESKILVFPDDQLELMTLENLRQYDNYLMNTYEDALSDLEAEGGAMSASFEVARIEYDIHLLSQLQRKVRRRLRKLEK